jgi:hypothetical protein
MSSVEKFQRNIGKKRKTEQGCGHYYLLSMKVEQWFHHIRIVRNNVLFIYSLVLFFGSKGV